MFDRVSSSAGASPEHMYSSSKAEAGFYEKNKKVIAEMVGRGLSYNGVDREFF